MNEIKDMQDRRAVKNYVVRHEPQGNYIYSCSACSLIVARTQFPMQDEGLQNKMRAHKCQSVGKRDFEKELR